MELKTRKERLQTILEEKFKPDVLEVFDKTEEHYGHSAYIQGGETHFKVKIRSEAFRGKKTLEIHRAIYSILEEELKSGLHALEIDAGGI
ncbi:stress induced morphogen [Leptospira ryugenii]|uniref:Stress induced morphogen n=1 Tax=Leptospira ryugenii TaxID=1917863 RepID=A0A2P2DWJ6_9LEPT|nr:BolA family protein [Leptospira ryugenii]GBF48940.1 stress induced morphogen [Leptospira ryugenii]